MKNQKQEKQEAPAKIEAGLANFLKEFNKTFDNSAQLGTDKLAVPEEVISFPSLTLGDATHVWGLPRGRIAQFHGPEGGGKTFMAMLMAKQAQEQYPGSCVIWVDAEYSFNRQWAKSIGIDMSRFVIIRDNMAASIFTKLCGRSNDKGVKIELGVLDHIANGTLNCKLIVLDSIANMIAPVEEDRGFDEQEMAGLARFLKKGMQRISGMLSATNTAFLCINQAREKIGARIPTLTYPGGRAWRHILSLAVLFMPSTAKEGVMQDEQENKKGHKIIATVEKTRFGADKWKAEFWLDFSKGVVKTGEEAAILGDAYGVVSRPNNTKWEYKDLTVTGKDNFFAALEERPDLIASIVEEIKGLKSNEVSRKTLSMPGESLVAEVGVSEMAGDVAGEE